MNKSIVTYPYAQNMSSADSFFINSGGELKQISESNVKDIIIGELTNTVNNLISELNDVKNSVTFQRGEVVTLQRGSGAFAGYKFNATTLRISIPMNKLIPRVPSVETENFSLNIYRYDKQTTITTAPTSVSASIVSGTNLLQLSVTYDSSVISTIPNGSEFTWRFNTVGDNYLRFVF